MGYYYNDPSGYGSWWVEDGSTPESSQYNPRNPVYAIDVYAGIETPYVPAVQDTVRSMPAGTPGVPAPPVNLLPPRPETAVPRIFFYGGIAIALYLLLR